MEVILIKDCKDAGKAGEKKVVSDGYAKNFLIPKGFALPATKSNLAKWKQSKANEKAKHDKEIELAKKHKEELEKKTLTIKTKTGETGKLYGAITNKNISEEIKKSFRFTLDKKKIVLEHPIKEVGNYVVKAKLFEGINANIKVNIESNEE
ncbi:MAG: 50S ribosomal protein L9 [Candidatus Muiribacterium halophilum]|uniref:Large ribosomal subunit protein bL9 n=1 Tax=Muiribacterium halophilum TaxID=2053465 RepID=A0A2N5ZEX0_MUIH1|nr:MAG: 50S ribosomal protein L9 [Candidatus Muirbacterium halophilum]